MKLSKFRITNFRSIEDSGWIEVDNIASFSGENESGKTNIFLALLKFRELGQNSKFNAKMRKITPKMNYINLDEDIPLGREQAILPNCDSIVFCTVVYQLYGGELNKELSRLWSGYSLLTEIQVSRTFSGKFIAPEIDKFPPEKRQGAYEVLLSLMPSFEYYREFNEFGNEIDFLALANKIAVTDTRMLFTQREYMYYNLLTCLDIWENNLVKSTIEAYGKFDEEISKKFDFGYVLDKVPLLRARLDNGFARLTAEFLKWWNDDSIVISYEPNKMGITLIILENGRKFNLANRSTGFKRFFSLFLSFSIANKSAFRKTVLLFDEAGAALHPLVQKKLEHFFINLSEHVQIMYNTHTAYMLSVSNLDSAKVVYKDEDGKTHISNSLVMDGDRANEYSLFAPHSSLALSVAEKQLKGCLPVIVVDESDEIYLSLIRNLMYAEGILKCPYNLLVFASGENGARAVADIFSSRDNVPPTMLLADDVRGNRYESTLRNTVYQDHQGKLLKLSAIDKDTFVFEDLFPTEYLALASKQYLKQLFGREVELDYKKSYYTQVCAAARESGLDLPGNFRLEVAMRCKIGLMRNFDQTHFSSKTLGLWSKIWNKIILK